MKSKYLHFKHITARNEKSYFSVNSPSLPAYRNCKIHITKDAQELP